VAASRRPPAGPSFFLFNPKHLRLCPSPARFFFSNLSVSPKLSPFFATLAANYLDPLIYGIVFTETWIWIERLLPVPLDRFDRFLVYNPFLAPAPPPPLSPTLK